MLQAALTRADESAFDALSRIPNDDPFPFEAMLRQKVAAGEYHLRTIIDGETALGYTVFAIDGSEFVSVATVAIVPGEHRYKIEALLLSLAKTWGCKTIRMHTIRPGLFRSALGRGWKVSEVILRKAL